MTSFSWLLEEFIFNFLFQQFNQILNCVFCKNYSKYITYIYLKFLTKNKVILNADNLNSYKNKEITRPYIFFSYQIFVPKDWALIFRKRKIYTYDDLPSILSIKS